MGDFRCVIVVFEVDEVSIDQRVVDASVSQDLHNVEDVFRFVVFHRGFVVSKSVKTDLHQSWILHFECDLFALSLVALSHYVWIGWEQGLRVFWQGVEHACQLG